MLEYAVVIGIGAALVALLGAWVGRGENALLPGVGLVVLFAAVAALLTAGSDPGQGVSSGQFTEGVLLGALLVGLLPSAAYYTLGVVLSRRPVWLGVAWLATLVPFAYYLFFAFLIVAGLTGCGPDAYECPL